MVERELEGPALTECWKVDVPFFYRLNMVTIFGNHSILNKADISLLLCRRRKKTRIYIHPNATWAGSRKDIQYISLLGATERTRCTLTSSVSGEPSFFSTLLVRKNCQVVQKWTRNRVNHVANIGPCRIHLHLSCKAVTMDHRHSIVHFLQSI